jgi:hypothetical protein
MRDAEERERRHELALNSKTTQEGMVLALSTIAYSLTNPVKVSLVKENEISKS